jgi:hypothetical protein
MLIRSFKASNTTCALNFAVNFLLVIFSIFRLLNQTKDTVLFFGGRSLLT